LEHLSPAKILFKYGQSKFTNIESMLPNILYPYGIAANLKSINDSMSEVNSFLYMRYTAENNPNCFILPIKTEYSFTSKEYSKLLDQIRLLMTKIQIVFYIAFAFKLMMLLKLTMVNMIMRFLSAYWLLLLFCHLSKITLIFSPIFSVTQSNYIFRLYEKWKAFTLAT
jgi:hypothetical protein